MINAIGYLGRFFLEISRVSRALFPYLFLDFCLVPTNARASKGEYNLEICLAL